MCHGLVIVTAHLPVVKDVSIPADIAVSSDKYETK